MLTAILSFPVTSSWRIAKNRDKLLIWFVSNEAWPFRLKMCNEACLLRVSQLQSLKKHVQLYSTLTRHGPKNTTAIRAERAGNKTNRLKVRPHRTWSAAVDCGLCPLRNVTF